MNINLQKKKQYVFKISDIHFEVDMELLGCNAKVLWNEIYKAILDILSTRPSHSGIILCKNFHKIHNEVKKREVDWRTAAFILAISRVETAYKQRGIFP